MKEYITTSKEDFVKIHTKVKEQEAYIKELELALESVKRQLANIKEANAKAQEILIDR